MERSSSQYDYLIKLLVIGDSGVGKTCFLLRFSDDNFTSSHLTTIGIDFKLKTVDVEGSKIKLQIWDTAGQERFRTITQSYYKGAMGIILIYDCTDENSFNNIRNWMQQIKTHSSENVVKILVGNKCDKPDKKVSTEQGEALAKELGVKFFEASAKSNVNVTEAFYHAAKEIKDKGFGRDLGAVRFVPAKKPACDNSKKACCG
ncbi:unnamed protein product [Blepharisma stoltei]|uniref:Uncharacterized protein n=1 Tax=Blepharisma stoltei TaxID=1481888 RepID=A0AAU9IAA7_9CILI|nr:unnamed protein product [Blepharisma stoltei]